MEKPVRNLRRVSWSLRSHKPLAPKPCLRPLILHRSSYPSPLDSHRHAHLTRKPSPLRLSIWTLPTPYAKNERKQQIITSSSDFFEDFMLFMLSVELNRKLSISYSVFGPYTIHTWIVLILLCPYIPLFSGFSFHSVSCMCTFTATATDIVQS